MEILKVILLAIALLGICILGLAIRIVLKKGGKFPNLHVGGNKHLQKQGIYCANTQDKIAQQKAREEQQFKNLKVASK
jgi:hypothetical protein